MGKHPRMRWKAAALKGKLQRMLGPSGTLASESLLEAEAGLVTDKSLSSDEERDFTEECFDL